MKAPIDDNRRFVEDYANPHSWLLTAEHLHEQAVGLYEGRSRSSILTKVDAQGVILEQKVLVDKSVFMLGGFALENSLKAFLVYENPTWISNGRLAKNLKTHSLTTLQKDANLVPYKQQYLGVLEAFESGLESWFRYPCALTIEETTQERNLYSFLWEGYKRVMKSYGKRLSMLLDKGWHGPHDYYGRWTMEGDILGYKKPIKTGLRSTQQRG
ncbi:hypothetical protein ES707_00091 [subsurface metagenome]